MNFNDIEEAFQFVSSDQPYMHRAYLSKTTGETFYQSEMSDYDELPEDIYENDDYIEIPHKNYLGLGQRLVWSFVEIEIPGLAEKVRGFFSRKGAYSRYKDFLEDIGLLDKWYEFEDSRATEALLQWCKDNEIEIDN